MVKGSRGNESLSLLKSSLQYFTGVLRKYIDVSVLSECYTLRTRNERLRVYHGVLRDACCSCFRGTNIAPDGRRCVVWGFDGKVWVPIASGLFRDIVGDALIGSVKEHDYFITNDWMDKRNVIMESAYAGVCCSPLERMSNIVGFLNGVWDFSDIDNPVYHPFSDMLPVTDLLPYAYDASAVCPLWRGFLDMMLKPSDVLKLQKYLGLGVMSRRMLPCIVESTLWLIGSGANGKTTIENVVRAVYGHDKVSDASMSALLDRNQISRLMTMSSIEGNLFNICSDDNMPDITYGSDAFKKLCSGEPQSARGIGENIHVAYDIPFLIFSMNQRPGNKRMDAAFRRRIVEIQFNRSVKPEDMDASLGSKLLQELPGIRNWMMEGYRKLVADGFRFDHTTDDEYMEANDQFFDLFAQREGLRASAWAGHGESPQLVSASVLYDRYCLFCERNMYGGGVLPSMKSMGSDLKRLGFHRERRAAGVFYVVYCDSVLDYASN